MRVILWMLLSLCVVACNRSTGHSHAQEEDTHGHAHGSDMTVDTTIWTKELELFVEYPAFVVGHSSQFAAHFTHLDGHKPVSQGSVTASLVKGKKGIRHSVDEPTSPGIFTPSLQPKEAGEYQLIFEIKAPGLSERIDAGRVWVYPDDNAAKQALANPKQSEAEISFLKEQAWKIDFQTAPVRRDTIYGMLRLAGRWMPAPGSQRTLNAPSSGNVLFASPEVVEGVKVRQGQVLMRISGENLNVSSIESEVRKARAEFEQAQSEYQRKKELHELQVIPPAEFEDVEKRYEISRLNYQQLLKNYSAEGVAVKAPFDGYLKHIGVNNGGFATAGQPLLTVGSEPTSMIRAMVAPEKRDLLTRTKKVWLVEAGNTSAASGKVISVARNVSESNPMLAVFIEVQESGSVVEGSLAELQLGYTNGHLGLIIPKSALLEDFGTYKVIVQKGGEAFEMRPVQIGAFNGSQVTIKEGLQAGEWVVTQGAYQVKMASMSAAPAHGHAH